MSEREYDYTKLDAEAIFERGFVTKEETESVELADFSSKVNLRDEGGEQEGIWLALLTEEDRELYNNNTSTGETLRGVLLNHALCFFPNPTWGRVLEGKTNGGDRPLFLAEDQKERLMATHESYLEEYPLPEEGEELGEEATDGSVSQ